MDGVATSRMVGVSASVNLPLQHKVQKFSSGTGSPGWSRKKGRKMDVVVCCKGIWISPKKSISVGNFVPNSDLEKVLQRHVDHSKCCRLSLTTIYTPNFVASLNVHLCVQCILWFCLWQLRLVCHGVQGLTPLVTSCAVLFKTSYIFALQAN